MAAKELFNTSLFLDDNLKAYYRLNSGGLLVDSKNGNTLTNNNSVSEHEGLFNGGANFGSNNSNKNLTVNSDFGINGVTVSISFWVKMIDEISSNLQVFFCLSDSSTKTRINVNYNYNGGNRYLGFSRVKTEIADQVATYGVSLGNSAWHNIILIYNGSTILGCIDGNVVTSASASGNGSSSLVDRLSIGSSLNNGNNPEYYSSIYLDDFIVFNRSLSAQEVADIYNGNYPDRIKKVKTNWFF